jgi:hypothetical protein
MEFSNVTLIQEAVVLWVMAPCRLVGVTDVSERHTTSVFYPANTGSTYQRKSGDHLPENNGVLTSLEMESRT